MSIPVTILTGFLGSGKTSLLNRCLKSPSLNKAMVLVNEFGEVGIDHLLIETADDRMIELSNGCLCCTIRGDLVDRLTYVLSRVEQGHLEQISRLIIETTGLADPVPILQLFMTHPLLLHGFHLDGVISVIDALHGMKTLEKYEEARRQVALADRIILSKVDLLTDETKLEPLLSHLATLNKTAEIFINHPEQEIDAQFLQCGINKLDNKPFSQRHDHSHHHHEHGAGIHSMCLKYDKPFAVEQIERFLDHLCKNYGQKILRLKAIVVTLERRDQPLIFHGVQGFFHPPQWLENWQGHPPETRLVVISNNIPATEIESLFNAFTGKVGIDTADFQTLSDNPLAIAGLKFI